MLPDDLDYFLTWFRNISLHLHPLVGRYGLLWLAGVVAVSAVEVVGAPQLAEVVGVEPVLAGVGHALQVGVEGAGGGLPRVVASHLTWGQTQVSNWWMGGLLVLVRNVF